MKALAGTYRKIYNTSIDLQQEWLTYSRNPKTNFVPKDTILELLRKLRKDLFPFVKNMDNGIIIAASSQSKDSFKRWFENLSPSSTYRFPKYQSRKKDNLKFKTSGNVKIYYDHISIPKLGDIKLFEKGYLPQGQKYSNVTFSHDGKDWWISLEAEASADKAELKGTVIVDFDQKGDVIVNGKALSSITLSSKYLNIERRKKLLEKKLKRQSIANIEATSRGAKTRTSRNMLKNRRAITVLKTKLENLRKDNFKKQASIVARTKPEKLCCLSSNSIRKVRNGGLTRTMREKHTLDLFSTILRKVATVGTVIKRLEVPTRKLLPTP